MGVRLALRPPVDAKLAPGTGRIGDLLLAASGSIPGLAVHDLFAESPPSVFSFDTEPPGDLLPSSPLTARLGDEEVRVEARTSAHGLRVDAEGFGSVLVRDDGAEVLWQPSDPAARERPELVLGPGLVLALAFQGVFCLHASAVLGPEGAVVFAGPSGAGKSTLAARLAATGGLPRLADDILPFRADPAGAFALPHFPQLKLPATEQYPPGAAPAVPVARLYVLAACDPGAPVVARPLAPSVAALAVCGQAVATRLFTARLLARLVPFAADLVAGARVRELSYPHQPDAVADVLRLVREA